MMSTSTTSMSMTDAPAAVLPALPRITYWRQTFSKLRLLALGFSLLIRLACLLFRTGTRTGTS
jgi:hypothetical protein